mmetsp:Transcript_6837/g.17056  ORF Transcript_6837/g.17056 Transcript_6837/m.17056 type:complete len:88 (-) Transcript_6837:827-1090(-)
MTSSQKCLQLVLQPTRLHRPWMSFTYYRLSHCACVLNDVGAICGNVLRRTIIYPLLLRPDRSVLLQLSTIVMRTREHIVAFKHTKGQ